MRDPVPVTLVTGFRAADKTTLLDHILAADTRLRFPIIETELGDLGMEASLLGAPRDGVLELDDGGLHRAK